MKHIFLRIRKDQIIFKTMLDCYITRYYLGVDVFMIVFRGDLMRSLFHLKETLSIGISRAGIKNFCRGLGQ